MEKVNYSTVCPNPKENASLLSTIFFWWTYKVIKKGRKVKYEVEDLPPPLRTDFSHSLGNKLEKLWQRETDLSKIRGTKPSLLKTLIRSFGKEFIPILLLHAFNDLFIAPYSIINHLWKSMIQDAVATFYGSCPTKYSGVFSTSSIGRQILLGQFLVYLRDVNRDENGWRNLTVVGILFVSFYGLNNLLQNHFFIQSLHLGCRIKVALTSLIYRKCLRLGNNTGENTSAGMIVNLLSNDMRQFDDIIMFLNYSWSGITSTIIILAILYQVIGPYPTTGSLLIILLIMPIQLIISKSLARNRIRTAYASDKRIQMMDEIICGIQIIKMYAWEKPYEQLIQKLRSIEMGLVRKNLVLRAFQIVCSVILSKFMMYILIVVYACLGGDVLPEKIFAIIGFFTIIMRVLCSQAFRSFGELSQCNVSVKRIQHFLTLNEFERLKVETSKNTEECAVRFSNVTANWMIDSNRDTIKGLNLTVMPRKLTTIIGQVGSGKSSLLNVILGELPVSAGTVNIIGSVSYYSQLPWIIAGTIRQNILFSQDFEQSRYDRVIQVCALNTDFTFMPHGDQTLVGERGITLSGGQKARIALARTIYRRADIYLLDDPLSAVDANVGKEIFENCILDFLKDKTRILITHQLQFLEDSDTIVLLSEGIIDTEGTFGEIMSSKANYLKTLRKTHPDSTGKNKDQESSEETKEHSIKGANGVVKNDKTELEQEDNETSSSQALFRYIFNGVGVKGFLVVVLLCTLTQMCLSGCEIWLAIWSHFTVSKKSPLHYLQLEDAKILPEGLTDTHFFIFGYTVVLIGLIIFVILRNCSLAMSGYRCAKKIHDMTFKGVVYTNSAFFHNNPSGRILNRFSKDLGVVDNPLPLCLLDAVTLAFESVAAFIVSSAVNPIYSVPAAITLISLIMLRRFYLGTSVTLKRLENITKSPVFVHVHTTMQGLPTIRSSGVAEKFIERFDQYQDTHTSAWYLYSFTGTGYTYGLEFICFLYLIAIVTGCLFLDMSRSKVGLALVQAATLLLYIQFSMKQSAEISNQATSIDRLFKYSSLPAEKQPENEHLTENNWPSEGKITFSDVSLQYNIGLEASIHNVSFTIQSMEKVGIVGRTGAGKSSLMAAIFRLGCVQGTIKIDDVDTCTVRLNKLRSNVSVIPQDPVLFSSTIRKNLDPFEEFDDAALWNALHQAELKDTISKEEAGLDSIVTERGRNFSVGQRQLICLARAILRKNKILILDEATASVDQQTDNIIQRTIREKFKLCTVLTIAHRLNTIVDSDKILVMDGGTAVEFGHPYELLQNQEGHFYKLVSKTGQFVAADLTEVARENFNQRQNNEKNLKKES